MNYNRNHKGTSSLMSIIEISTQYNQTLFMTYEPCSFTPELVGV